MFNQQFEGLIHLDRVFIVTYPTNKIVPSMVFKNGK